MTAPVHLSVAGLKRYPLLVAPERGESLPGFLHRLARENGFARAGWLRQDVGLHTTQTDWADEHFQRMSICSGQSVDALRRMDCPASSNSELVHFKGHLVDIRMLDRMTMRYCPMCLANDGYHRSVWFLRFITVCPTHGCEIIERCATCGKRLNWNRRRFLECQCGAPLTSRSTPPEAGAGVPCLHGARALYEKCGEPHGRELALACLPSQFASLDLESFCSLLWFTGSTRNDFATYRSRCGPMKQPTDDMHVTLEHGYQILSEWPQSFHRWLDRVRAAPAPGWTKGLNKQFGLLERKLRNLRRPQVLEIIQDAVLSYAVANGIYVHDRQSLLVPAGSTRHTRMISIKEAARILGCAAGTATKIAIDQGWLDAKMRNKGGLKAVSETLVREYRESNQPELGLDTVRDLLNVRHETLEELLEAGIIGRRRAGARHQSRAQGWSVTEADVEEFKARISACVCHTKTPEGSRLITLKTIAGRYYLHRLGYVDFIQAVLRGELIPRGRDEKINGPAGLLFDEVEAIRFYSQHRDARARCLTPAQAGRLISMPEHHVRAAVSLGLLPSENMSGGRRACLVSVEDAERFSRTYVSTVDLAEQHQCSDVVVRTFLSGMGIQPAGSKPGQQVGCSFYERRLLDDLNLEVLTSDRSAQSGGSHAGSLRPARKSAV